MQCTNKLEARSNREEIRKVSVRTKISFTYNLFSFHKINECKIVLETRNDEYLGVTPEMVIQKTKTFVGDIF